VVGGIVAATGWQVVSGGVRAVTGNAIDMTLIDVLSYPATAWLLGVSVAVAVVLLAVQYLWHHPIATVTALVALVLALTQLVRLLGYGEEAETAGWFLRLSLPSVVPWHAASLLPHALVPGAAELFSIVGIAVIYGLLTNLLFSVGIEAVTHQDMDLDRELHNSGLAHLASALVGGFLGAPNTSLTVARERMRAAKRWATPVTAAVPMVVLLSEGALVPLVPVPIIGGFLIYLGLNLIVTWVNPQRRMLTAMDRSMILVTLFASAALGFVEGLVVGLLVGIVVFVVEYSQISMIKFRTSLSTLRSNVERSPMANSILNQVGPRVPIIALRGFIFFASAHRLSQMVRTELAPYLPRGPCVLVLDLREVDGIDAAALVAIDALVRRLTRVPISICVTGASPVLRARLLESGAFNHPAVVVCTDLNEGLELIERGLLGPSPLRSRVSLGVNAGVKMHRLAGVKMHHG